MPKTFEDYFNEYLDEAKARQPDFDPGDYYRSGRSSKANPNKEDAAWWLENGPTFVDRWTAWRKASGLRIAEFPGEGGEALPGIELEVWAQDLDAFLGGKGTIAVRSVIDRVFEDSAGTLHIVDLKSGSHTAAWPLQMALNNLGLRYTYGVSAKYAGFWKARTGGVDKWHSLEQYTDEVLWDWVAKAKAIRDQGLFIPQPTNLCTSACGVSKWCVAMGGQPFSSAKDATVTQGRN